ncbi:MAG: nucleotidyltransferase family protein [bacterium]|nr:nucleotidyltransferase family protein [bacterium]
MELQEIKRKASPVFERYGIARASVFGSFSRGDNTADSDIDIMVKLGTKMDLVQYIQFRDALVASLGRDVDLVTESSVSPHLKSYIIADLRPLYELRNSSIFASSLRAKRSNLELCLVTPRLPHQSTDSQRRKMRIS